MPEKQQKESLLSSTIQKFLSNISELNGSIKALTKCFPSFEKTSASTLNGDRAAKIIELQKNFWHITAAPHGNISADGLMVAMCANCKYTIFVVGTKYPDEYEQRYFFPSTCPCCGQETINNNHTK